jgi:indolepyruvate ferredoxin oxidoreductase
MLIKDEVYCSQLLTSPEKYERDRRRFNIDPAVGDRLIYKHHNRPEFEWFGQRFRFEWTSRDWQLRLVARMGFLRRIMPGWHRRERDFRDWYSALLKDIDWAQVEPRLTARNYQRWLAILQTPETVTGFREVRYPKMEAARRLAQRHLATDPQLFEPGSGSSSQTRRDGPRAIKLPVLAAVQA